MTRTIDDVATPLDLSEALIQAAFVTEVADDHTAMALASEQELLVSLDATLADRGVSEELWVFGYGSLMWRPELAVVEQRIGRLEGWQRSFCLWQWRFRGTREHPGLMLALDEGRHCTGVLFRLAGEDLREQLIPLWRREMTGRGYVPRWVEVASEAGPVAAITFLANRQGNRYAGVLPVETIAHHIATACGHSGPNASYLLEAWRTCRKAGIEDGYIEALQRHVAVLLAERGRATTA